MAPTIPTRAGKPGAVAPGRDGAEALAEVIADAMMRAAVARFQTRGLDPSHYVSETVAAIRRVVGDAVREALTDASDAVTAGTGKVAVATALHSAARWGSRAADEAIARREAHA